MTPAWPREFGFALLIGAALPLAFCLVWSLMLAAPAATDYGRVEYWLFRYQTLVAGGLGLTGGYLAYRAIRAQIDSSERQHWRREYAEAIMALSIRLEDIGNWHRKMALYDTDVERERIKREAVHTDANRLCGVGIHALRELNDVEAIATRRKQLATAIKELCRVCDPAADSSDAELDAAHLKMLQRTTALRLTLDDALYLMREGASPRQIERTLR